MRSDSPSPDAPAGDFSSWLRETRRGLSVVTAGADVPCGACTGCCRASMFIHIRPEETRTLARIPRGLRFPAPGMPKGHMLLGYDDTGKCPMLVDEVCSIYEDRPQTCRDYDCRVFAATGIDLPEGVHPQIAERVGPWRFTFPSDDDREAHAHLTAAAEFLVEHRGAFPEGALPKNPTQLAVLAIRVYRVFSTLAAKAGHDGSRPSDAEIAKAVLSTMEAERVGGV